MGKELSGKPNDFLKIVLPTCAAGKIKDVKQYLKDDRFFVKWVGPHGRTMLWEAARNGKTDLVKLLVEEHSADPHSIGCYYRETCIEVSPWLIAKLRMKNLTAQYLESIEAGLDFSSACYLGEISFIEDQLIDDPSLANQEYVREHQWNGYQVWPLQYAVNGGQPEVIKILIKSGAIVNASPQILFEAINQDRYGIVELLLSNGADPFLTKHRDWFEKPNYNALARKYEFEIKEIDVPPQKWPEIVDASRGNHDAPDDPKRVETLIKKGHDVNVRDYKGKTALHRASQAGFLKITKLLLDHGANLEAKSHDGETPIFDAAFYGRTDQLKSLIDYGANIEPSNAKEETPVFAAIRGGKVETLKILLEAGASMDGVNLKGKSPYDLALSSNKIGIEEVRKFLKLK